MELLMQLLGFARRNSASQYVMTSWCIHLWCTETDTGSQNHVALWRLLVFLLGLDGLDLHSTQKKIHVSTPLRSPRRCILVCMLLWSVDDVPTKHRQWEISFELILATRGFSTCILCLIHECLHSVNIKVWPRIDHMAITWPPCTSNSML